MSRSRFGHSCETGPNLTRSSLSSDLRLRASQGDGPEGWDHEWERSPNYEFSCLQPNIAWLISPNPSLKMDQHRKGSTHDF